MKSREITLWLDERWYDALSRHLKDETVEDKLGDYLDQLINELVPEQEYSRISQEHWRHRIRTQSPADLPSQGGRSKKAPAFPVPTLDRNTHPCGLCRPVCRFTARGNPRPIRGEGPSVETVCRKHPPRPEAQMCG